MNSGLGGLDSIREIASGVQGWLTEDEGALLYRLAANCSCNGVIVEIGSWKGKSTIWLAHGSKAGANVSVYAVDPHTGSQEHGPDVWTFNEFKANIAKAGVEDVVVPVLMTSEEASRDWKQKIELLFIDGDHQYESVEKDFLLWFPHLNDGGIVAFHDSTSYINVKACLSHEMLPEWEGPRKVVGKYLFSSTRMRCGRFLDTITWAQKCSKNSVRDRIMLRITYGRKLISEFKGWIIIRVVPKFVGNLPTPIRKQLKSLMIRIFRGHSP